jgi:hypothetical protein
MLGQAAEYCSLVQSSGAGSGALRAGLWPWGPARAVPLGWPANKYANPGQIRPMCYVEPSSWLSIVPLPAAAPRPPAASLRDRLRRALPQQPLT